MAEYSSFAFGGIRSSSFGLFVAQPPAIPMPVRRETREEVPGRNGTLVIDGGGYEDITVTYTIHAKLRRGEVESKLRGLKAWLLANPGIHKLEDSYDPGYFRYASYQGGADFENVLNRGTKGTISFVCAPLKYSYIGQQSHTLNTVGTIINPEAFESLPQITVYGSGAGILNIANQTIQFSAIDGYITLDSDIQQAFKGEAGKNNTVSLSSWPTFQPGENRIQWSGGITRIEYIPRWCTL